MSADRAREPDVADVALAGACVQTGRESLERAIRTVDSKKEEWGARVVYGDTDSLFVQLPGRSKQEAFRIGKPPSTPVYRRLITRRG